MCMFKTPSMPTPQAPVQRAAAREPDGGAVMASARRTVTDRLRAMTPTILTGNNGAMGTGTKTSVNLLGQTGQVS